MRLLRGCSHRGPRPVWVEAQGTDSCWATAPAAQGRSGLLPGLPQTALGDQEELSQGICIPLRAALHFLPSLAFPLAKVNTDQASSHPLICRPSPPGKEYYIPQKRKSQCSDKRAASLSVPGPRELSALRFPTSLLCSALYLRGGSKAGGRGRHAKAKSNPAKGRLTALLGDSGNTDC